MLTVGTVVQIGEVKEKITKEKGWEASTQKLIYSGESKLCRHPLCRLSEPLVREDTDLYIVQARYYKMQIPLSHTTLKRKGSLFA